MIQSELLATLPRLRHGFTSKQIPKPELDQLASRTATARQVHKADLIWVNAFEKQAREADAVATLQPNLSVGVYSADCTPILLAIEDLYTKKIYGIAAIHGGWRSTALGIANRSLRELSATVQTLTPNPIRCVAAIGPCISYESFEVGEDVIEAFPGCVDRGQAKFFRMEGDRKKYLFDLPGENRRQLEEAAAATGSRLELEVLGLCTLKRKDQFPSYRRDRERGSGILSFVEFVE